MEFVYSILERERPALDVGDRFWTRVQLTLARQSETVGSTTGLGGRDEADQDGGNLAGFYRGSFAARGRSKRANRTVRSAHSAGVATGRHGRRQSGPGSTVAATRAGLSAQSAGTGWCLSALFPGPQCGAGMHGNLRAGIPAERHGDCASHELLLARRLGPFPFRLNRNGGEAGTGSPAFICATQVFISCSCRRHRLRSALRRGLAAPRCIGITIIATTVDFPSGSYRTACETRWPQKQRAPDRRLFCIRSYLYPQLAGVAALSSSS